MSTHSRRQFISRITAGSLATLALPTLADAMQLKAPTSVPDEAYWESVKKQFAVPANLVMFNAANLCPSPASVNDKVQSFQKDLRGNVSMQYRAVFAERRKKSIELLAKFIGADANEVGITRNTSESNCTIIHGLDLKAGDEVILWDQNHPSNKEIWMKRAERDGIVIRMVTLPQDPTSPSQQLDLFSKSITSKTKVIAFSHISNVSGMALPAKEICSLAKSKNILSLVDGAQTLGFQVINVKELGCDFYTASTHKWLMGPLENGILYMRKEHIERIWPSIVGGGWHDTNANVDDKICFLGQRNDPPTAALPEIVAFHETIGKKIISDRVYELSAYLKQSIKKIVPAATLVTPMEASMSGGIVIINIPGRDPKALAQKLYEDHGIAAASTIGLRMSPHIYNTKADVDRVVQALAEM